MREPKHRSKVGLPAVAIMAYEGSERGRDTGKITDCAHSGCNWRCCQFMQGNYIVLYPGEVAAARSRGETLDHLDIFDDDYHGGSRATCCASDTASCDGGYKPLDCATYPFFPLIEEQSEAEAAQPIGGDPSAAGEQHAFQWLFGQKCPLIPAHLGAHLKHMQAAWRDLMQADDRVAPWLRLVRLVGYQRYQPHGEFSREFGR